MKQVDLIRKIYWISGSLVIIILVFLTSVIFLNPSSVGNRNFLWFFNLWAIVWAVIFIVVLILTFILARNLIKVFFEYQASVPGRRLKSKMILTFALFSLFPALIMSFVAFGLINQNLTKWVSAPSEQLLNSSQQVAAQYYRLQRDRAITQGEEIAAAISAGQAESSAHLREFMNSHGLDGVLLVGPTGAVAIQVGDWFEHQLLEADIARVLSGEPFYQLNRAINVGPIIDEGVAGVPLPGRHPSGGAPGAVFTRFSIQESVAFHTDSIRRASEVYEGLRGTLASVRINYFSILGLTTLAVVFGFAWLGSYIARKLTIPLEALAEGSRELAEGNLDHRVEVKAVDELGILVDSFNRMAAQLKESRGELERANQELRETNVRLDERRRYIETVLQNIATGVLTIDEQGIVRTANEAALKMLQLSQAEIVNQPIRKIASAELYSEFQLMTKRAHLYGTYRKQVSFTRKDRRLHVAATITRNPLPLHQEEEYLLVLDDLTELIRAEKFAAWQEVARRLAHEIKNPLTPIQLSAERIKKRFSRVAEGKMAREQIEEFGDVLSEATRIIVSEAEMLKNLVAEFTRFARLPICRPEPVSLHELIEQTIALYDGSLDSVELTRDFDPEIGEVRLDREQIQRVFINLLDNSLDALADANGNRKISIRTVLNSGRRSVTIEFQDTGIGIPPEDYEHLFLPYFSTKKKGTGLGLAIVRQIISDHNGFIRAEPRTDGGTRFTIELPVGQTENESS